MKNILQMKYSFIHVLGEEGRAGEAGEGGERGEATAGREESWES